MKSLKLLFILMALMVTTGLKALDTLSVQNLPYKTITIGSDSINIADSLTYYDPILSNYHENCRAKGYKLVISSPVTLEMICDGKGNDTYSFLFDEEFGYIDANDDYVGNNTGYCRVFSPGVYYWVITGYSASVFNFDFNIRLIISRGAYAKDLQYMPIAMDSTVTDTLTGNDVLLYDIREGKHVKGYTFTVNETCGVDISLKAIGKSWDTYLYLLDNHYKIVNKNDDASDNGSRIETVVEAGTYYILVTQYGSSDCGPYSLTLSHKLVSDYKDITYTPIVPDTTIIDSITLESPAIVLMDMLVSVAGYSVSLNQGDVLNVSANAYSSVYMLMFDAYFRQVAMGSIKTIGGFKFKAEQAGTYYMVIIPGDGAYGISFTIMNQLNNVYYVDAVNGEDKNDGLTPATAVASLEQLMMNKVAYDGGATCYIMSDVNLSGSSFEMENMVVRLLPYNGMDITITCDTACEMKFNSSYMEIGHKDSGSVTFVSTNVPEEERDIEDFMRARGSNVCFNHVIMRNITAENLLEAGSSTLTLNNCIIENNVASSILILAEEGVIISNNTRVAYNKGLGVFGLAEASFGQFNNVDIIGNTSMYAAIYMEMADLKISGGMLDSNEGHLEEEINLPDTMLTAENMGGIISIMSQTYISGDFTMNNNYAILFNGDKITLGDVTASKIGVILPVYYEGFAYSMRNKRQGSDFEFNYEEGLPVLAGNVYPNYKRFDLYQPFADTTWYIISDGTLSVTDDVDVAEAEEADDNVYIYPNPTSGMLNVRIADASVTGIRIIDIQGRIITSQQVTGESVCIDMQSLAHGMYFVQVMNHQGVLSTRKVVKK